jgi:hypothetical protein
MRPYLAVIRDSFHEALVSRVLWILLALSTLLLVLSLPLGIVEQAGSVLQHNDILDPARLIERIVAQGRATTPSPGRRIWELLEPSTRDSLSMPPATDRPFEARQRERTLEHSLREMIKSRNFYRAEDWSNVVLPAQARELRERGLETLADDELARFNRLALEAAYPDEIAPSTRRQVQLAYFRWELGLPLPVQREQLFPAINQLVALALGTLLGVAGVFVSVLVTASMIPQAFEAGSVDLLLSKPISRSLLFLSKFIGGCAFIAINAAYLIGGLWLVLGLRFGLWNARLLWAIPLYLFLFAIYYGVSALAGVMWRNAIVSVVMAIVFWFVCWSLGTANGLVETLALTPRKLQTLVPAGKTMIAANSSTVFRWDDETQDWQSIFAARDDNAMPFAFMRQLVGPVYDARAQRILAFRASLPGVPGMRGVNRLLIGKQDDEWRRSEGITVPEGAAALLVASQGEVIVAGSHGIHRLEGDLLARQQDINFFGVRVPLPERGGRFANIGPRLSLRPIISAAMDPVSGNIGLLDGRKLVLVVRQPDGKYQQAAERSFDAKRSGKLALASDQVFLTTDTGELLRYDMRLEPRSSLFLPLDGAVDAVTASGDGLYLAAISRRGILAMLDLKQGEPFLLPVVGQGSISALAFEDHDLLVADRLTRVTRYHPADRQRKQQFDPPMSLAERIYRYALHPLYTVFPKPGQLNETVSYVLTPKDTTAGAFRFEDQDTTATEVDVWGPIWSNSLFLVVLLAVSCVYVSRRDF